MIYLINFKIKSFYIKDILIIIIILYFCLKGIIKQSGTRQQIYILITKYMQNTLTYTLFNNLSLCMQTL